MILLKILIAAILTFSGSLWIDRLYRGSEDLSFPKKISERSKFRRPILFCALSILFCMTENIWIMTAIFFLVLMTATDFEQYMLFDAMTLPFAILGAFYAWQWDFLDGAAAAILGGGIFLLLAVVTKGALGGGDVKLIAASGFWLGSEKLLDVMLYGTIAGGVVAVVMILTKKKDRKSYIAYGPYFTLTAIYFMLN